MTAVGGTDLVTNGGGGPWTSETAWTDSGGGISPDDIPMPGWQTGVADSFNKASTTLRNVPDVAMEANTDNFGCNINVCKGGWGGTSFAAPRWAAFMALFNQQAAAAGLPEAGFINPSLYAIGQGANYYSALHDITSGNNNYVPGSTYYSAVAGYDLVTGWGSPNGKGLFDALAGPQVLGFWLSASPGSLTINPGASLTSTIAVRYVGGFSGSVTLSVSGLPSGVSASFATNPTTGSSVLTLTADNYILGGAFPITITGVSGTYTATTLLALDINSPLHYVTVTSPAMPLASTVAQEIKPGTPIPVVGTVVGAVQNLSVQWAAGINPAAGWNSSGITLNSNISMPVTNQTLATWDTSSIVAANYYTIRVTVVNSGGTNTGSTIVYLEPSLLSSNWPMWVSNVPTFASGVVPVNQANGKQTLAWASDGYPSWLWLSSPDGASVSTVAFTADGELYNPSAGSLDGMPGDEVATGVGAAVDVFQLNGSPYASFPGLVTDRNSIHFAYSQVLLDDVDGDSLPETLAMEEDLPGQNYSAYLNVWRASGAELSSNFPITIADLNGLLVGTVPRVLTGDIDGDGKKEILVIAGSTSTAFTPLLFNSNGSARAWLAPAMNGNPQQMVLADLDDNGKLETVMVVNDPSQTYKTVHVLQPDGSERPGWPVTLMAPTSSSNFSAAYLAVGDLNQDGNEEIVASDGTALYVFNTDGSAYSSAWPFVEPTNSSGMRSIPGPVVLADINGDGFPEILTTYATAITNPLVTGSIPSSMPVVTISGAGRSAGTSTVTYSAGATAAQAAAGSSVHAESSDASSQYELQTQLVSFDLKANLLRSWNLLGVSGQQPCDNGVITVGDFNQDGLTEIAVSYPAVSQQVGEYFYCMAPGAVTVLGTGEPINPAANNWPMINQNPRNTAVLRRVAGSTVSIGSSANPPLAGQQFNVSAVVAPAPSASGTPTGVVNLLDNGKNIGYCQLSSSACTVSATLALGSHNLVTGYVGDSYFASSLSTVLNEVVGQSIALTSTVLSITPSGGSLTVGASYKLTATVSPLSGSSTPTGDIIFTIGSDTQTVALDSSGVATYSSTAPSATGSLAISAAYQGTPLFSSSTSNTLNETIVPVVLPSYSISGTSVTISAPGATASNTSTITVTPANGFTGSVALTASITSSPAGALYPPSLTFGSTTPVAIASASPATATLTVSTTAATYSSLAYPSQRHLPWFASGSAVLACLLLCGIPARRRRWQSLLGIVVLLIAMAGGAFACGGGGGGGGGGGSGGGGGTSPGTYAITVNAISGATSSSTTISLNVQ